MTKREAAIVSAYTGYLCGDFSEMHKYIEEIMGEPIFTQALGNPELVKIIHEKAKPDFVNIIINE